MHKSLSSSLRERDKEREQHRKDEAITHFKALLADMVSILVHFHYRKFVIHETAATEVSSDAFSFKEK